MEIENILNAKSPGTVESSPLHSPQMSQPQLAHHAYYTHDSNKEHGVEHLNAHQLPERMSQYPIPAMSHAQSSDGLSNVFSSDLPYAGRANPQHYSASIQQQYASAGLQESGMNQSMLLGPQTPHTGHATETSLGPETSQPKSFACSTCAKGFARRSDLARHERIHSGIRPHVCSHEGCGKEFIQRSALTVHERVHTGEKPHVCESCAKPFSDSSSLARHRRIHSGKRPYKCAYPNCHKSFTRKTTLTRHQNHHAGSLDGTNIVRDASRHHESEPGNSGLSDMDERSEGTSSLAASSPGPHILTHHPNMVHAPMMHRQSSDMTYSTKNPPSSFRGDSHQPDSSSSRATHSHINPLLSLPGQTSMTSDPNSSYRHRPPHPESEPHYRRESPQASPHIPSSNWPNDNRNHAGLAYSGPEYQNSDPNLYYGNPQPQRMWSGP